MLFVAQYKGLEIELTVPKFSNMYKSTNHMVQCIPIQLHTNSKDHTAKKLVC